MGRCPQAAFLLLFKEGPAFLLPTHSKRKQLNTSCLWYSPWAQVPHPSATSPRSAPAYSLGKRAGGRVATGISPDKKKVLLKNREQRPSHRTVVRRGSRALHLPFLSTSCMLQSKKEGFPATSGGPCLHFDSGWSTESCRQLITSRTAPVSIDLCLKSLMHRKQL